MSKKFRVDPLFAEGGTLVAPGTGSHVESLFGQFTELRLDPEIEEEEQRVSRGKLRHRRTAEHFFVPTPLQRSYDRRVCGMPKRPRYEFMPGGTTPDLDEFTFEECGTMPLMDDDGLELSERIAELLERQPFMVYTVYTMAVRERRETIIYALINAAKLLEPGTKAMVAKQVKHFSGPMVGDLAAALAS